MIARIDIAGKGRVARPVGLDSDGVIVFSFVG